MDLIWIFVDATLSLTPEGGFNWKMQHGRSRLDGGGSMPDEGGEVLPGLLAWDQVADPAVTQPSGNIPGFKTPHQV